MARLKISDVTRAVDSGYSGLNVRLDMRSLRLQLLFLLVLLFSVGAFPSVAGEFEGEFQVGHTSCTVTPIKMAFEVRWKRGDGYMLFFFDGKTVDGRYVFISEEKRDGKDRFEFDDERLLTGVFVRSDGKIFSVSKVRAEDGGGE